MQCSLWVGLVKHLKSLPGHCGVIVINQFFRHPSASGILERFQQIEAHQESRSAVVVKESGHFAQRDTIKYADVRASFGQIEAARQSAAPRANRKIIKQYCLAINDRRGFLTDDDSIAFYNLMFF